MSVSSIDTKLSCHVRNKAAAAQFGDSVCVGAALRGSGRDGGGVPSLMDWEELAESCTTPGGKIKQRLEAHKRGGEGKGVLGDGAVALCESRTQR